MTRFTEIAPAKINLSLHVGPPKENGRHNLISLVSFADQEAADLLTAEPASHFSLAVDGPFAKESGPAKDNLVLKAARAMNDALDGNAPPLAFRLQKNLPCAAGIGGGSADAGAALRLIVRAHGGDRVRGLAETIAPLLGGDVLACLTNLPGFMSGEGEAYDPVLSIPKLPAILINPGIACPTGRVFSAYDEGAPDRVPEHPPLPDNRTALRAFQIWLGENTENSLQSSAMSMHPEITKTLADLQALSGIRLARMSGSGATCFGLFDTLDAAEAGADLLSRRNPDWWVRATLLGGA
ncbi:MAG: 4-(cytidine 5'-diphospho)-2-C-methyl-D-erythritol kinase [Hyphomonadaceae bacterium]|nr:4-(cytidine 5'-diphospho)-2-C-methyl-D-erythritol kinase [Hyphomonadaceae bacterium]